MTWTTLGQGHDHLYVNNRKQYRAPDYKVNAYQCDNYFLSSDLNLVLTQQQQLSSCTTYLASLVPMFECKHNITWAIFIWFNSIISVLKSFRIFLEEIFFIIQWWFWFIFKWMAAGRRGETGTNARWHVVLGHKPGSGHVQIQGPNMAESTAMEKLTISRTARRLQLVQVLNYKIFKLINTSTT